MKKQLLIEYMTFNVSPRALREGVSSDGRLIVSGVLQRANAKNQNGRIYPREILEREVARYMDTEVAQRRALGELDHPESSVVNLRNVSHNILECQWEGDDLVGKVEVLSTPSGNILKELFRANVTLGISSRGLGSVKTLREADENGQETLEVQPDFELITFDFVSNPSTHGAFLSPNHGMSNTTGMSEGITRRPATNAKYLKAGGLVRDIICELSGVCCI